MQSISKLIFYNCAAVCCRALDKCDLPPSSRARVISRKSINPENDGHEKEQYLEQNRKDGKKSIMIMTVNSTDLVARQRKVVDAFTRTLHALMAASFGLAYITSEMDGFRWLHAVMGYTLGTMFLIRLTWSVLGPRRVRLQSLAGRLAGLRKIHELIMHFQWQEILRLLLTVSVFSALIWTLPVLISGYATYFGWLGKWLKEIHETLANIMLLVVMCHIASVIILTVATDGQQIRPMLTGNVKGNGPDLVKHNLVSVGVALLLLVANFWSWQAYHWIHDPQFKEPPRWLHPVGGYVEENAD